MSQGNYRVVNTKSLGFCDFTKIAEAIVFYKDGIMRNEPYTFIVFAVDDLEKRLVKEAPLESTTHPPTQCCNYTCSTSLGYPIMWNPFNKVVQCHNCGNIFLPTNSKAVKV